MTDQRHREPIFNLPRVVMAFAAILIVAHIVRAGLPRAEAIDVIVYLAFVPARYGAVGPGAELGPKVWSFLTYAFLHGSVVHLMINLLWLAAFGSPVAWRFGPLRFVAFCVVAAVAGAVFHLVTHFGEAVPMVGASAVISGLMAGAIRFAFRSGAPLGVGRRTDASAYRQPAMDLRESFSDPRTLLFIGVWLVINLIFGVGTVGIAGEGAGIAWQAHIGGFAAGLLTFSLFDPVGARSSAMPPDPFEEDSGI